MGNVNNCLNEQFEFNEIKIRHNKNALNDKAFYNYNSKNNLQRNYLINKNKKKLDIIKEENIENIPKMKIKKIIL